MIITYFGSPGCGKTTLAVKLARQELKRKKRRKHVYKHAFCNFETTAPKVKQCDLDKIGEWTFPQHSFVCLDEAGIEFNSRAYKSLPKPAIAWFKLHRHYRCDVAVFSQSWEDMDITIRRLSTQLWYLKKLGPWTLARRVYKFVTVDENTKQIIDGYKMASPLWLLIIPLQWFGITPKTWGLTFRPFYYRWFDSYSTPNTPVKYL